MTDTNPAVDLTDAEAEVDLPTIGDRARYDALMQVIRNRVKPAWVRRRVSRGAFTARAPPARPGRRRPRGRRRTSFQRGLRGLPRRE